MQYLILVNWFTKGLKSISFLLDEIVYSLSRLSFSVFCYISEVTLIDGSLFEKVTSRVYVVLGIVMTFILTYYLLNYIVDPDKAKGKDSGASTLIKDIIIALVIITITPTLFTKLYGFQHTIITSGVISRIFLGGSDYTNTQVSGISQIQQGANETVANVFSAFIIPQGNYSKLNLTSLECEDLNNNPAWYNSSYCKAYREVKVSGDISEFYETVMDESNYKYWPLLSTVAGIALAFFMLSFCVNLGMRVGKMAILQIIAPIPALLEIVPGKKGTRKTWVDTLIKVYLEVFVFQAVIFIVIFLMTLIPGVVKNLFVNAGNYNGMALVKIFSLIFIIFGLFQFAKEAPKMVMDLLGIKSTGVLAAGFKRGVNMFGATASGIGSATTSGVQNITKSIGYIKKGEVGKGLRTGIFGTASGILGGLGTGMYANRNGGLKGIRKGASQGAVNISRYQQKTGQFFDHPIENLKSSSGDRIDAIKQWATSGGYEASNAVLQSYGKYTGVFDSTKINTDNDERYNTLQNDYTSLLTNNGITSRQLDAAFKAWRDFKDSNGVEIHKGMNMHDYLSSGGGFAYDFDIHDQNTVDNLVNLDSAMASRKDDMKVDKRNNLVVALAQAKALVDRNPDIAKIAQEQNINLSSLTLDTNSDRSTTVQVYDQLKKLNDAVKAKRTAVQAEIAAKEMAKNAKSDSSGSKK